jgi:hypothetical protein
MRIFKICRASYQTTQASEPCFKGRHLGCEVLRCGGATSAQAAASEFASAWPEASLQGPSFAEHAIGMRANRAVDIERTCLGASQMILTARDRIPCRGTNRTNTRLPERTPEDDCVPLERPGHKCGCA